VTDAAAPRKVVAVGALPLRLPEGTQEIAFSINDPGVVRKAAWALERRLVMTRGEAQFDEVLTLFVEFSPNGPKRNRRFVVVASGEPLSVPDGYTLSYVDTAVSANTGQIAHVYEIRAVS